MSATVVLVLAGLVLFGGLITSIAIAVLAERRRSTDPERAPGAFD